MQDFYVKIKINESFNEKEKMETIASKLSDYGEQSTVTLRDSTAEEDIKFIHVMIKDDEPNLTEDKLMLIMYPIASWYFEIQEVTKVKEWERQ